MERSVAESWATITDWLAEHLPGEYERLQPPAPWSSISAVRAGMGRRLPSDLLAWLNLNNGIKPRGGFGNILPVFYTPMMCEEMLGRREMLRGICADSARPGEQQPAGTRTFEWLDGFLPIGDAGTDVELFVDLRDGDLYGCVGQYDAPAGGFSTPRWMSITEMLADVADALILDQPALQDYARRNHAADPWSPAPRAWHPYLDDGRLRWNLVELDEQGMTGSG
ncbi:MULTISPECIES: SMI1/KNR4 family protein [unclassified Kribbella]|uniref:SMI1/KNR4 family protein n=1 Tax=unclassified Kribbella TaxID=2644121 RepID=UPI0030174044